MKHLIFILFLSYLYVSSAFAQIQQICGTITDEYGNPLENVKITQYNTNITSESNNEGRFCIKLNMEKDPNPSQMFSFSFRKQGYEVGEYNNIQSDGNGNILIPIKLKIIQGFYGIIKSESKSLENVEISYTSMNPKKENVLSLNDGTFILPIDKATATTTDSIFLIFRKDGFKEFKRKYSYKNRQNPLEILLSRQIDCFGIEDWTDDLDDFLNKFVEAQKNEDYKEISLNLSDYEKTLNKILIELGSGQCQSQNTKEILQAYQKKWQDDLHLAYLQASCFIALKDGTIKSKKDYCTTYIPRLKKLRDYYVQKQDNAKAQSVDDLINHCN